MADAQGRPPAEEIILYEEYVSTKIAPLTFNRPDKHNAITIAAGHRFAQFVDPAMWMTT